MKSDLIVALCAIGASAQYGFSGCNPWDTNNGIPNSSGTISLSASRGSRGFSENASWTVSPAPEYVNGQYNPAPGNTFSGSNLLCWDLGSSSKTITITAKNSSVDNVPWYKWSNVSSNQTTTTLTLVPKTGSDSYYTLDGNYYPSLSLLCRDGQGNVINPCPISINPVQNIGGQISVPSSAYRYSSGATSPAQILGNAIPNPGWLFHGWIVGPAASSALNTASTVTLEVASNGYALVAGAKAAFIKAPIGVTSLPLY